MFYKTATILALILAIAAFWQSGKPSQAGHLPTLDVGTVRWLNEQGAVHNQIWAGSVNFGDEVLQGRPGELASGVTRMWCGKGSGGYMTCIASDVGFADDTRRKQLINLIGHENQPQLWQQYFGGTGLSRGPFIVGREGWPSYQGTPQIKGQVQFAIYENKICFAPLYPEAGSVEMTILDSCMTRELVNGQPDLKFTAGNKYVLLSELAALLGR